MIHKAVKIPADLAKPVQVVDLNGQDDGALNMLVFGRPWRPESEDIVSVSTLSQHGIQFAYDDNGLYTQPLNVNVRAMKVWAGLVGRRVEDFKVNLVGDYVILGLNVHSGETADVPLDVMARIEHFTTPEGN